MKDYSQNFEDYRLFLNKTVRYDIHMFGIPMEASILDIGCGFGDRIGMLRDRGYMSVRGIDPDEYCVSKAVVEGVTLGSITDTGLPSNSVEVALVENVFHHIDDYSSALSEIGRILKPDGCLCFTEPRNSFPRKVLDFVTFKTPVPSVLRGPWKMRKVVMGEEVETGMYPKWLRSHHMFLSLLEEAFEVVWLKKNIWFFFCKARKRSLSET